MANEKPAVSRMRNISSAEQSLIEGEKQGAQRSREFNDIVNALKLSPNIGGQLLTLPGISDILKSGGQIKAGDLPMDIRNALNNLQNQSSLIGSDLDNNQLISLPQDILNRINKINPAITPFSSLKEIANLPSSALPQAVPFIPPASPINNGPSETILEQSDTASGGLQELLNRILNSITPTLRATPQIAGGTSLGTAPLFDFLAGRPTQVGGTAEQPITGQAPDALEGLKRLINDFTKSAKKVVPSKTREEVSLDALTNKFPELAGRKDKKGLEKFAGAGEFTVNGNRYKIDNSGRIVKIGA